MNHPTLNAKRRRRVNYRKKKLNVFLVRFAIVAIIRILGKDSHRYYLLDEIFPTEFAKSSDYGMMNRRDFYLYRWLNYENNQVYSAHEVAEQLRNKTWE